MPDKERPVRLDYTTIFTPDARPELDRGDLRIQLGLALRHIEGVADALAKSLINEQLIGWRSLDPRNPFEISYDDDEGTVGIYVKDTRTGSKNPDILCYTSTNSGRREIHAIIINNPSSSQRDQLHSLPLLQRTTLSGSDEKIQVPNSWSEITIESFGIGLSRGPFHILPGKAPKQSSEGILFSEVSRIRLVVGGRWENGKGDGEEVIAAYVIDVVWDFDLNGFVSAYGRRAGISRVAADEAVYTIPLLGTDEGPGLLDPVVAAFVAPAKAKNIPIVTPQSLGETTARVKTRGDESELGRPRISLNLGLKGE